MGRETFSRNVRRLRGRQGEGNTAMIPSWLAEEEQEEEEEEKEEASFEGSAPREFVRRWEEKAGVCGDDAPVWDAVSKQVGFRSNDLSVRGSRGGSKEGKRVAFVIDDQSGSRSQLLVEYLCS
ncbi:hypothetical protein KM043_005685 [Ampulex compressa]|nr:hypothetical protein KM043_005685 [Ampulex compressa]